eukprot:gene15436-17012_t
MLAAMTFANSSTAPPNSTNDVAIGNTSFGLVVEIFSLWILLGNLVIILVVKLYKPLTIPDILVFSLALSDVFNSLLPLQLLNMITNLLHITWTEQLCITFTFTTYCLRISSVFTITVISLDRLIAVHKPLVYRSRVMHEMCKVKILMITLWIISCFLASLPFISSIQSGYHTGKCDYQLIHLGLWYGVLMECIGWLQLFIVLYCYITIKISTGNFIKRQHKFRKAQGLKKVVSFKEDELQNKRRNSNDQFLSVTPSTIVKNRNFRTARSWHRRPKKSYEDSRNWTNGMRQVAKMEKLMAALVFLFYLSWLPFLVSNLVSLATRRTNETVIRIVGLCSLINGLVNPIIYATVYPRYKRGYLFVLKTILRLCGGRKPDLTTADFNLSKRDRSKRLETLREVLSTTSLHSHSEDASYSRRLRGSSSCSSFMHADMLVEKEQSATKLDASNRNTDNCGGASSPLSNTTVTLIEQDMTLPGESLSGKFDHICPESKAESITGSENDRSHTVEKNTAIKSKENAAKQDDVFLGIGQGNAGFQEN